MVFSRKEFLESTYEESKEEILFSYETEGTQNFKEIKSEKREEILIALMDCAKLSEVCKHYKVQLYPENLYYDIHRHVKVMFRDVYGSGEIFEEEDFLNQCKSERIYAGSGKIYGTRYKSRLCRYTIKPEPLYLLF